MIARAMIEATIKHDATRCANPVSTYACKMTGIKTMARKAMEVL